MKDVHVTCIFFNREDERMRKPHVSPCKLVSTPLSFTSLYSCMCSSCFNMQIQRLHSVGIHMQMCTVHRVRRAQLLQET